METNEMNENISNNVNFDDLIDSNLIDMNGALFNSTNLQDSIIERTFQFDENLHLRSSEFSSSTEDLMITNQLNKRFNKDNESCKHYFSEQEKKLVIFFIRL